MITAAPLKRLLVERELTMELLAQASGIEIVTLYSMVKGKHITKNNVEKICSILNCQPSEVIEYSKSETKGHWVYVQEE